jgi:hypothetical protein
MPAPVSSRSALTMAAVICGRLSPLGAIVMSFLLKKAPPGAAALH